MTSATEKLVVADLRSSGRLWAFAFGDGRARALSETESKPQDAQWLWQHFALSDNRSRLLVERWPEMPEQARAMLLGGELRVQIGSAGDWCFGVLPDYEHQLGGDSAAACRLNFAFNGGDLVTTRRHALQVVDAMRREFEQSTTPPHAPADAVALHVAGFIDATELRLAHLSAQLDHAEDQVLSERGDVEDLRLGPIRRQLSAHHRDFAALRSAFQRASTQRHAARAGALAERLPPLVQELEDFDRDLAGLQDRAKLVHDEIEAQRAQTTNRSLRALTILSTLMLPPTVIVGAFGMNVRGIPFAQEGAGFWSATVVCVLAVAVAYWVLKRSRVL